VRGVGAAIAVLCLAGIASAQPLFTPPQDPLAGSRVFGAKGCAQCHAIKGTGGQIGPDLGRTERPRSFYHLAAALWNHAPRMADRMRQLDIARPRLDARESADLVAFLFTADYFDPPGDAEAGRRLFVEKRCVACHQRGGVGGVVGPNLDALGERGTPIYVAAAMWNHGPQMSDAMRARKIARPTFRSGELRNLLAYLATATPATGDEPIHVLPGNAEQGRRLFTEKHCIECHSVRGIGGKVGPDLADRAVSASVLDFAAAMWNKAPAMGTAMKARAIPMPQLQPGEVADVLAFLYSVRYLGPAGDPRRGAAVAEAKGCVACHGASNRAGDFRRARGLEAPAILAGLWNHSFIGETPARRERVPWGVMTDAEMLDLIAFLQTAR
jgi:mono/diheme cytochrome c family protein